MLGVGALVRIMVVMTSRFTGLRRLSIPAALFAGTLFLSACGDGDGEALWGNDSQESSSDEEPEETPEDDLGESDESNDNEDSDDAESQAVDPIEPHRAGDVFVTQHSVIYGAEDAEIQIRIYEDMQCPYCKEFSDASSASVNEWIELDDVSVEYVVVDFLDDGSEGNLSRSGANILAVTKRQDPENWLAASRALLEMQDDSAPSEDDLLAAVSDAGVAVDDEFEQAVATETYYADVEATTQWAGEDEGVTGIPTVEVNDSPVEASSFEEMVEQINDVIASN